MGFTVQCPLYLDFTVNDMSVGVLRFNDLSVCVLEFSDLSDTEFRVQWLCCLGFKVL